MSTIFLTKIQPVEVTRANLDECFQILGSEVETPIHDSIRELVTWECKEHECLSKSERKC
jgi:hypothetical protein